MTALVVLKDNNNMNKKSKLKLEFRYYEIPQNEPVLAMLGSGWIREYGVGIESLHFHNLIEIGYCYEGTGELIYDEVSIPYTAGTFTFIPANYPHTTNSTIGTFSRWEYLFVDTEILKEIFGNDPIFFSKVINRTNSRAIAMHTSEGPIISGLIRAICNEMRDKNELYHESVKSLLIALFLQIVRLNNSKNEQMNAYNGLSSFITSAVEYIGSNYANNITIAELADVCHMSETHFRRLFEKAMNMKPVEYINLTRVQAACDYMKKHDSSMTTVAIKNGFQTTSTMNRNFNKFLGVTPYQWKSHPENYEGKLLNFKITALKGWD